LNTDLLTKVYVMEKEAVAISTFSGALTMTDLADLKNEHILQISKSVQVALKKKKPVIGMVTKRKVQALA
jgi:hypothetical protein